MCYETINNLNQLQQSSDPIDLIKLQCVNALLSDKKNIDDIISTLAHLVFTMDEDEISIIQATYNIKSSENEKYFVDRIAKSDYNYYLKYADSLYIPAEDSNIHLSYLIIELSKKLELMRLSHKKQREAYKGTVQVKLDYTHDYSIDETPLIFDLYEEAFNQNLVNDNITVSFED